MQYQIFQHYRGDAYFNMAFDEWLLQNVIQSESMICLRLYSWSEGTVTFGYNQNELTAYDHDKIQNTPVIRRITGGRAIFHDESELTYSLAVSADLVTGKGVFAESVSQASSEIALILVSFLKSQKIRSEFMRHSSPMERDKEFFHKAPCFDSHSKHEILSDQRKIIASAQRRISGAFLQHGSIKIKGIQSHPAIPGKNDNVMSGKKIPALSQDEFNDQFTLFRKAFERYFKHEFSFTTADLKKTEGLQNRLLHVQKKCLEKRDIFKQNV